MTVPDKSEPDCVCGHPFDLHLSAGECPYDRSFYFPVGRLVCSKCGEARDSEYTCRDGGTSVPLSRKESDG